MRKLKRNGLEAFTDRYQGLMRYYGMEVAGPRSRLGFRLPASICQAPALQAGPDSASSDRLPNTVPWSRPHSSPRNAFSSFRFFGTASQAALADKVLRSDC